MISFEDSLTDAHLRIATGIIADLEQGVRSWAKTWDVERATKCLPIPMLASGRLFRIGNLFMLCLDAMIKTVHTPAHASQSVSRRERLARAQHFVFGTGARIRMAAPKPNAALIPMIS